MGKITEQLPSALIHPRLSTPRGLREPRLLSMTTTRVETFASEGIKIFFQPPPHRVDLVTCGDNGSNVFRTVSTYRFLPLALSTLSPEPQYHPETPSARDHPPPLDAPVATRNFSEGKGKGF